MSSNRMNEDVYESEDLPESEQLRNEFNREETNDPDHIEMVHIDIEAAKKRFEGRTLNLRDADFSDSIAKKRMHKYGNAAYVLEVVGSAYAEPETPEQRFNRLTYEINELSEQIKGSESDDGLLSAESLDQLKESLKEVREPAAASSSGKPSSGSVHVPVIATGDTLVLSMEQRLRRLETLVGPLKESNQPLVDALEDLRFRTDALNPTYVEGLESRLNQVLTKLEQVESKRAATMDGESEAKVNELLALMTKWDVAVASLPSNVKKIQALHGLYEQAQQFSERLAQLVELRTTMEKGIAADKSYFRDLQTRAKEEMSGTTKKIQELEQRLAALSK